MPWLATACSRSWPPPSIISIRTELLAVYGKRLQHASEQATDAAASLSALHLPARAGGEIEVSRAGCALVGISLRVEGTDVAGTVRAYAVALRRYAEELRRLSGASLEAAERFERVEAALVKLYNQVCQRQGRKCGCDCGPRPGHAK